MHLYGALLHSEEGSILFVYQGGVIKERNDDCNKNVLYINKNLLQNNK
jgi:hypothetical protein